MLDTILKLASDLMLLALMRDTMSEEQFNKRARARIAEAEAILGGLAAKQKSRWEKLRGDG